MVASLSQPPPSQLFFIPSNLSILVLSAAPINITFITSDEEEAGTQANFYMSIFDSTGKKTTIALPKPLDSGSTVELARGFVNVQDVAEIVLRTFSIDGWKFEAIEISMGGSTYNFNNPNGQIIDKYSGQVALTPN